jgi:hypothetical protein
LTKEGEEGRGKKESRKLVKMNNERWKKMTGSDKAKPLRHVTLNF